MSNYTSEDINNTIRLINQDKRLLDMIIEVDGLLEHLGLYAYKNWQKGKIVEVGRPSKYFVNITLMYERDEMPDPEGLLRLKENDCEAKMYKDTLITSRRVKSIEDTEVIQRGMTPRRIAKKQDNPVWIVEIKMPRRYVDEFSREQVEAAEDSYIDMEAMQGAQDQSLEQPNINPDPNLVTPGAGDPLL